MNREEVEQRSLEEVKRILSGPDAERTYLKRFDTITLEGSFPDTHIVLTGEHVHGGEWRIRFPVWDENHAILPQEGTRPDYPRLIGFLDIDLREKQPKRS